MASKAPIARFLQGNSGDIKSHPINSGNIILSKDDTQAAADVYELSSLLTTINTLKQNRAEALRKLEFVQKNKARRLSRDSILNKG